MFKSLKMYNFLRVKSLLLADRITIQMWVLQFSNSVVCVFFFFKPDLNLLKSQTSYISLVFLVIISCT